MIRSLLSFSFDYVLIVYFFWKVAPLQKTKWRTAAGFLLLAAVVLIYLPGSENVVGSSPVRFAFRVLCYFLFVLLVWEIDWKVALYDSVFGAVLCVICQNIFMTPLWVSAFQAPLSTAVRPLKEELLSTVCMYLLTFLIYLLVRRVVDLKETKNVGLMQIFVQGAAIVCSLYVKKTLLLLSEAEYMVQQEFSVFSILLQAFLLVYIVLFERYVHSQVMEQIAERQKIANRYLLKHLQDRKDYDEKARQIRHDWKNHMLVIGSMAEKCGAEEITSYIRTLLNDVNGTGIRVETGNVLADGLLTIKVNEAERKEIDFNIVADFREVDFIAETDLCTLLGNALDNAIEAAERVRQKQNRFIEVRSGTMAGCVLISISNGFEGKLKKRGGMILTTKRDPKLHGYGLGNMKRTLEKYDGVMDINAGEKNHFVLTMTIPVPREQLSD